MSELGDKESRFVEDQRAIEAATTCCGDYWSDYAVVCAGCPMLSYNRRTDRKDALLAEAAEVLRAFPVFDVENHPLESAALTIPEWWSNRAKPLLDKLGERVMDGSA